MAQHSDDTKDEYLFTYGTLQPGCAPAEIAHVVLRLEIAGRGFVHGTLYDFGHYPGAVLDAASATRIPGTIYKVPPDPALWVQLDDYEEYFPGSPETSQFLRELHTVNWDDGWTGLSWVYVFNSNRRKSQSK